MNVKVNLNKFQIDNLVYDFQFSALNFVVASNKMLVLLTAEGPTGRKALLQRYLEKRKDRFKGKRTLGGPSSSNMEMMYLSQQFRGQIPNEQLSRSDTSSPTQPRPPCTPSRCSSIEIQTQKQHISVDLNDDGGGN